MVKWQGQHGEGGNLNLFFAAHMIVNHVDSIRVVASTSNCNWCSKVSPEEVAFTYMIYIKKWREDAQAPRHESSSG